MKYIWQVNEITGRGELQEENRITVNYHGRIDKVLLTIQMEESDRMFFNGYQTWTWSPEYNRYGGERGINHLPRALIDKFSLDRYGDYHFYPYGKNRGEIHGYSYCYFRDKDRYRLFASLSEENGYHLFRYNTRTDRLYIERDCKGLEVDGDFTALEFCYLEGGEQEVFDSWFRKLFVIPNTREKLFGYSSWYNRYEDINADYIAADLEGCKDILKPGDLFQIDDGWEPNVGDWLEPDPVKFPEGMKASCDRIHEAGFKAGLWLAPFVCNTSSEIYKNHPDWLLKHEGEPWLDGCNWGGFVSLDLDNPEVRDYITKVFRRVFDEWGFDLVKLDFLYAGAVFGDEKRTRGGKMLDAMRWLRDLCAGKLILGCGVPLMPAFGNVDYCRVSCDVSLDWNDKPIMRIIHKERVSTRNAIDTTYYRRQLNNRAFLSDPDVFFLRDDNIKLTLQEKEYLYTMSALHGGILLTSDNLQNYDETKKQQLSQVRALFERGRIISEREDSVTYELDGEIRTLNHRRTSVK
ncbi:MAG: alpha-galactosidase [Erysipelotrichaceae bacterium]|nr:alpha-galactosidase [Erysipelotrichaceae bacterium]